MIVTYDFYFISDWLNAPFSHKCDVFLEYSLKHEKYFPELAFQLRLHLPAQRHLHLHVWPPKLNFESYFICTFLRSSNHTVHQCTCFLVAKANRAICSSVVPGTAPEQVSQAYQFRHQYRLLSFPKPNLSHVRQRDSALKSHYRNDVPA